jgi:hypothetical protein
LNLKKHRIADAFFVFAGAKISLIDHPDGSLSSKILGSEILAVIASAIQ